MIDFKIYKTTKALPDSWDALPTKDIFLKRSFLSALELSSPKNIFPYYLGIFKKEKLVGIAIIQRVEMYLDDIFRNTSSNSFKQLAKRVVSKIVRGNALVIGNLMHTGQHSLFFIEEEISYQDYLKTIFKALKTLQKQIKEDYNKKVRIIAFKDYFETDPIHKQVELFKTNKLYKVQVQPNMLLPIKADWETAEHLIASYTKKYKKRYKTARKKSNGIERIELNIDAIKQYEKELYVLYKNVSDNARVNSFVLSKNHFYTLKKELKSNFKVFGYFLNDEIVGFYTLILNYNTLETYFLGYNKIIQQKHQMYLNMLYDMACFAIEYKFKTIVYARTAMEIKSSVGAKPNTMHIYMKHTNNFIANTVLKFIVKYLNPVRKWTERNPFK